MKSPEQRFAKIHARACEKVGAAPVRATFTVQDWKELGFDPNTHSLYGCNIELSPYIPVSTFIFPNGGWTALRIDE